MRVRSAATLNTAADDDIKVAKRESRGGAAMVVRAMALLLLLNPSVGQPELSDACRDPARRNPCEGHREVACFLAGISLREVHHLRAWVRDPEMEAKAHQMNHQQDEEKEVGRQGTLPDPIHGHMSAQQAHIAVPRDSDFVLDRVTQRLEKLANAAVQRRGWPMKLKRSEEAVFFAVYTEGRGFYHRHRDVLGYFTSEIPPLRADLGPLGAGANVASLVKSMTTDPTLYPQSRGRVLSIVVQLAEGNGTEYEGGMLNVLAGTFDEPGLALPHVNAIRRDATVVTSPVCPGDVIIHPAFTVHEVTPITKGIRESLTWWVPGELKESAAAAAAETRATSTKGTRDKGEL